MRNRRGKQLTLPLIVGLFFVSGGCGLVYQVLWLRLLGLTFGVTVYAASTVWASFMTGLALGSLIGGWLGDRVRRPLAWFGTSEVLIGLSALASPYALAALQGFYVSLHPSLSDSLVALSLGRGAIAGLVLLVPTVLMGATLPLVVRSGLVRQSDLGSRMGLFYGTNTAGAIVGTLAAGLYLVPQLGISGTFRVGAALNVMTGLVAIAAGLSLGGAPAAATTGSLPSASNVVVERRRVRWLVLIVFTLSGFSALALEVIWLRVIVLVARPTVYAFAMLLASILCGIALGSYVVTPLMRRPWPWLGVLAALELLMSGAVLISLATLGSIGTVNGWIEPYVARVLPAYLSYPLAAAVPAVMPTSFLMGMAFPMGLRLWAGEQGDGALSRVGLFYALNLAGAIAGSLAAGFVLLPMYGSRASLIVVAAVIFLSGLGLMMASLRRPSWRLAWGATLVPAFAFVAAGVGDPYDAFLAVRYPTHGVLWREEAVQGTVSVHDHGGGGRGLYLDGNHQASDAGSMVRNHRLLANLPMALHPSARAALVVGLGGGATAGAVSTHEGVEVDVVELSASVVRASEYFRHVNFDLLRRPNVRLRVDDGRNYLMLTPRRYDVVTADIILPIHAGSNNIYSREYFALVRDALRPGGLAMQWVFGTDAEHRTIVRTFLSVFPHTTLWGDGTIMIGSLEPLQLRRGDFEWKRQLPGRRQALDALGAQTFDELLGLFVAGPDELTRYVGDGPVLSDDRPLVEYFLSLPRDKAINLDGVRGDVRRLVAPS